MAITSTPTGGLIASLDMVLAALLISFPRPFAFVSVFAPLMWAGCHRGILRFGIALVIALPVFLPVVETGPPVPTVETVGVWSLLMFKEAAIGIVLGLLMSTPFWAAQLAGAALSIIRAETADESPLVGDTPLIRAMMLLMICAFAYGDGLYRMADIFYITHALWPVDTVLPVGFALGFGALRELVLLILNFGISILLPFLVVITLIELAIAFSTRFTRRLTVSAITLDIRALVILAMLTLSVGVLVDRSAEVLADTYDAIVVILRGSVTP